MFVTTRFTGLRLLTSETLLQSCLKHFHIPFADFEVSFPQVNSTDYITMDSFSFPSLSSLTVCLWERSSTEQPLKMRLVSYSTATEYDAFSMDMEEASGRLGLTAKIDGVEYVKMGRVVHSRLLLEFIIPFALRRRLL